MMHHGSCSLPCEAGEGWGGGARSAATRGCQLPSPASGGRPGRERRDVSTREIVSNTASVCVSTSLSQNRSTWNPHSPKYSLCFRSYVRCSRCWLPSTSTTSLRFDAGKVCDVLSDRHLTTEAVPEQLSTIVSGARGSARCRWKRFGGLARGAGSMSFAWCDHCVRFPPNFALFPNSAPSPTLPRFAREGARAVVRRSVRSS